MSSNLQENLAAQQVRYNANSARRKKVMDAVLALAAQEGTDSPVPVSDSSALSTGSPGGTVAPTTGGFNPDFNVKLQKLLKDYQGKVTIKSGYRSPERQAQLWQAALKKYGSEAVARKWVAPPGHSNHNRGLAADLGFADPATIAAVHANAAKYGLIFPLANENWHIEPIGIRK